jgi:tetratricopeptide (TPR) repeat protein
VFERLSVFAGGCTLAGATAVCASHDTTQGDLLDLLSSLVDKSLVAADFEGSEPRYRLLESFREYAREKLATRGEQNIVMHRHALAYLEQAKSLDRIFYYEPDEDLQARAREELDNWRAALEWTLGDRSDVILGQRLAGELCVLWQNVGPLEGRRWVASALKLVDERTPTDVLARLNYTEATLAMTLEQYEAQRASSEVAVGYYRVVGDSLGTALAQAREAQALINLKRIVEAKSELQEALPLARNVDNGWLIAWILRLFGGIAGSEGNSAAARGYITEALRHYEAAGSKIDIGFTMLDLSEVEFGAGNAEPALRYAVDALATFRTINHARGVSISLDLVAQRLLSWDRYDEAETSAREALEVAREHHLEIPAACALQLLAAVAALRPHPIADRSATAYARAARVLGFFDARPAALDSVLKLDRQEYDRALNALREALGADAVAKLMDEGATLTEEQAVEDAAT